MIGYDVRWSDLICVPDDAAVAALRSSWRWLLGDAWTPVLFSIWGDVFMRSEGGIFWLNTGTAQLTLVARDEDEFRGALAGDCVQDWFLPPLVASLHAEGKRPRVGECFSYAVYPVFAEGKYEIWNFAVVPVQQHFEVSAHMHRELASLPEATKVRIEVGP